MSAFKVGDVCVIVDADDFNWHRYMIGMECEILALPGTRVAAAHIPSDSYWTMVSDGAPSWFRAKHLRLKRPPNKDEPITDFTPADDDFVQDLMKRVKQRERC